MEWNACVQEPDGLLRWLECHSALGSYLQLVGVVIAIGGSVWITRWSTTRLLRPMFDERSGRAKIIIYRLMPPVSRIKATTMRIRKMARETKNGRMLAESAQLERAINYFRIDATLPDEVLDGLHVLNDETAETIAQLYYYHSQYNAFIDREISLLRNLDDEGWKRFDDAFDSLFGAVESLAKESWDLLTAAREAAKS